MAVGVVAVVLQSHHHQTPHPLPPRAIVVGVMAVGVVAVVHQLPTLPLPITTTTHPISIALCIHSGGVGE